MILFINFTSDRYSVQSGEHPALPAAKTPMAPKKVPFMRGQIEYFTSPYEQKMFSDFLDSKLMMAKLRRNFEDVRSMAPGIIMFAAIYTWGNATHERLAREHRY